MSETLETWQNKDNSKRYKVVYDEYAENPFEAWDEMPHVVWFNYLENNTDHNVNYNGNATTCKQLMGIINDNEWPNVVGHDNDIMMNFIAWRDDNDWIEKPSADSIMSELEVFKQWRDGNVFGIIEETRHEWHDNNGNTMSTWDVTDSRRSVFYGIEQITHDDICDAMGVDGPLTKLDK